VFHVLIKLLRKKKEYSAKSLSSTVSR